MAIRLERALFCERVVPKATGEARAINPHDSITEGELTKMVLLLIFRGSAGRYDVRLIRTSPGEKPKGGTPEWLQLDGRHEHALSLEFDCSRAGQYRFDLVMLDGGAAKTSELVFEVHARSAPTNAT